MIASSGSNSSNSRVSKNATATTPAMRRFIIIFAIVEAVMIGWAVLSTQLR